MISINIALPLLCVTYFTKSYLPAPPVQTRAAGVFTPVEVRRTRSPALCALLAVETGHPAWQQEAGSCRLGELAGQPRPGQPQQDLCRAVIF